MLVFVHMLMCTYVYVQVCMQMCILVCMLVWMHNLLCVHVDASMQACVGVCMCLWIIRDLMSRFSPYSYRPSGQWTTFWDQFSMSTMWVREVNLRFRLSSSCLKPTHYPSPHFWEMISCWTLNSWLCWAGWVTCPRDFSISGFPVLGHLAFPCLPGIKHRCMWWESNSDSHAGTARFPSSLSIYFIGEFTTSLQALESV